MSDEIVWKTRHGDTVTVFPRRRLRRSWHYHVQAANGRIGDHGEGYARRIDAVGAALRHHPQVEPETAD